MVNSIESQNIENRTDKPPKSEGNSLDIPTSVIQICNGRLGGVGKTTLARLLCERYLKIERPYTLIDSDEDNYNVARAYDKKAVAFWESQNNTINSTSNFDDRFSSESLIAVNHDSELKNFDLMTEQIIFSHDDKLSYLGDRLLEIIDRYHQDIIVSLPANDGLEKWLDRNQIDSFIAEGSSHFKVTNWWCSFGGATSQQKFINFVHKYPHLDHVIVFNLGITSVVPNWHRFSPLPDLVDLVRQHKVKSASILPWVSDPGILEAVDRGTPLHEIIERGWLGKPLNPIIKGKIQKWLVDNWAAFQATGHLS